jgi:transporter family protein
MIWVLYAFLSAIFAALVAILGKIGLQHVDSTLATTVRAGVMAVFLFLLSLILGKYSFLPQIKGKVWLYIVLSGVAGALSWLFYFFALKMGLASAVSAIDRLSVVFVVILSVFFLGEHFSLFAILGAVLMALGAVMIAWK